MKVKPSRPPASCSACRSARPWSAAWSTRSASRSTTRGRSSPTHSRAVESTAPGIADRQPVDEPMQTGIKAIDAMTPDRPRPARADHRRPQDRQDRHRHRRDPQPEGPGGHLRLRRRGPERVDHGAIWSTSSAATARWTTRSSSPPVPATRLRSSTSPLTPAARWPSTSCTRRAARPFASTTTFRSRPSPIANCRSCSAARRAAKPIPATSSTPTRDSSNGRPSSPTST